jgi:hypothetical protein
MRRSQVRVNGMMAVRMQRKEDFGTSSWAADSRVCLFPFVSNGRIGGVPANGQRGNTSEDDADEASYGQHENRCNSEKRKHPKLSSILIGALIVAERREHRDLLLKSTGPV